MSSSEYTFETKTTTAANPRWPGSTVLVNDELKLVYNKYKTTRSIPQDAIEINLIFNHGTGMNKSVWHYYVERLYALSRESGWWLNSVIAIDSVGHGDSGVLNQGKLGWCYKWEEGAKDTIKVVREEQATTGDFLSGPKSRNILVAHSLGAFHSVMAAFYEPVLFDSVVSIEGVFYGKKENEAKFRNTVRKLRNFIVDRFETKQEFEEYFTKFFIYSKFHPKILEDFMKSELRVYENPKTGEKTYGTKTTSLAQLTNYVSATLSLSIGMSIYEHLTVPLCHIVGDAAKWNPPECTPFVRNSVPAHLLTAVDIKGGEHLVVGEKPDELIDVINSFVQKRIEDVANLIPSLPEVKYNGNRKEILNRQFTIAQKDSIEEATSLRPRL